MKCSQCGRKQNPKWKTYFVVLTNDTNIIAVTQCPANATVLGTSHRESEARQIAENVVRALAQEK